MFRTHGFSFVTNALSGVLSKGGSMINASLGTLAILALAVLALLLI